MNIDRRCFLKWLSVGVSLLGSEMCAFPAANQQGTPPARFRTSSSLTPFLDPLPRLSRLRPDGKGSTDRYRIGITKFQQKLHSQLSPTTLWGYESKFPGPLIEARRNRLLSIEWQNRLPRKHLLEIDPRIHGAASPTPEVRTVTHLHGAHTASRYDGLPEAWVQSGDSFTAKYPNRQRAATLWYHDHALGITRLNNYAGLSGMYLLRDEEEDALNLPSGEYEIPIMLHDRTLDSNAQLVYRASMMTGEKLPSGVWGPEFFGDLPLVNGAILPYLEVEPRRYRFRFVNAANSRFWNISLSDPSLPFINVAVNLLQVGNDGGLLPSPVEVPSILLAPAERADFIVDFAGFAGKKLVLVNHASVPFPGGADESFWPHAPLRELMQVRVSLPKRGKDVSTSKSWSVPVVKLDPAKAVRTRDFVLLEYLDDKMMSLGAKIDGKNYHDPITEKPKLGSIEIWRFINTTDDTHPMHIHLAPVQVIDRRSFDQQHFANKKELRFVGTPRLPEKHELGWKDTVQVNPGEVLSVILRFEEYAGKYVFHCHMLEHEDNDMMRPFEVVG